ncbi:MAG: ATP-binding protein [Acidobacteriota bacterium]
MQAANLSLSVAATFEGARDAAHSVRGFLDALSVLPREAALLELAVAESLNNIIEHASCDPRSSVDLHVDAQGDRLRMVVVDEGLRNDPDGLNNFMSRPDAAHDGSSGLGIALIRRIMDLVYYARQQHRNVLTMVARVNGQR